MAHNNTMVPDERVAGVGRPGMRTGAIPTQVIRELSEIERFSHDRPLFIFEQWLDVQLAHYHAMPLLLASALKERAYPTIERQRWIDMQRPEIAEALGKIKSYYGRHAEKVFGHFHKAQNLLWQAAESGIVGDWLGGVYQEWELSSRNSGQFFTPWNVASMMAQMALGDDPTSGFSKERPLTIYEPAAGSGVMLLAAIDHIGPDPHRNELVRYYAIDIDLTCVKMTRIQLLLYGTNGYEQLTKAARWGEIDVDCPESVANYERAYDHVVNYVEHGNALAKPLPPDLLADKVAARINKNGTERKEAKARKPVVSPAAAPAQPQALPKPPKTVVELPSGREQQTSMFD